MSAVFSTPSFLKALAPLAKENQVSNKVYKAKQAAKAKRVKEIEQTRKIADKMDKELTKLEKVAEKEAVKQAKIAEKEAKIAAKEAKKTNVVSKEEKIAAKAAAKEAAKEEKVAAKAAAKEEKVGLLRRFDAATQRTTGGVERFLLLPASEATFRSLKIKQIIRIGGIPSFA